VISVFSLMSPNFSHLYGCSLRTRFSSKLHGSCQCILIPCHLSFVFCAVLPFICLIPLSNSLLRHLALCNIVEMILCWCMLTICISGFSLQSTCSTSYVISTTRLLNCIRPFPPCFLGAYK